MESKLGVFVHYKNPSGYDLSTRKAIASHAAKSSTRHPLRKNHAHNPRAHWTDFTTSWSRERQTSACSDQRREQELQRDANYPGDPSRQSSYIEGHDSEADSINQLFQVAGSSLYSMMYNGFRTDPFNAFPIPNNKHIAPAIDFWINSWAPSVVQVAPNPFITEVFPLALQREEVFAALVAFSTANSEAFRSPGTAPSKVVLHFQGKAIQIVREKLLAGVVMTDYASLVTTIHLMGTDVLLADEKSYRSHMRGLRQMAKALEKTSHNPILEGIVQGFLAGSEFQSGLVEHQDPLSAGMSTTTLTQPTSIIKKQVIQYPIHPFPPPFCQTVSKIPIGLQELVLQGTISIQVTDLIRLVSIWIASLTVAKDISDSGLNTSELAVDTFFRPRYITRMALSIFISLPESLNHRAAPSIEHCICLNVMSSIHAERSPFRITTTYVRLVSDFIDAAESLRSDFSRLTKAGMECLVWLCFTSAGCAAQCFDAQVARRGSELIKWLVDEPRVAALGIRVWERVQALLKRFFWYQHLAEVWQACWNAAIDRATGKDYVINDSVLP